MDYWIVFCLKNIYTEVMKSSRFFNLYFDPIRLAASLVITFLPGILGSVVTINSVNTWYSTLRKPFFSPPNWIFGPVWTTLYFLMGVSLYLVWISKKNQKEKKKALVLFMLQLFLNGVWSFLFFGFQLPLVALFELIMLWFILATTLRSFVRISSTAALLLIPYFLWVSFAMLLNAAIVLLN